MQLFEWILVLLLGAVLLAAAARRLGAPYPALLAVGGALLALVPGGPRLAERARDGAGGSDRVRAVRAVRREYAEALGRAAVLRDRPGQLPEAGPRRQAVAAARR